MTSVIGVKHKRLWSVPDEMQVPAECLVSARRGRAADPRVIFTKSCAVNAFASITSPSSRTESLNSASLLLQGAGVHELRRENDFILTYLILIFFSILFIA